MNTKCLDALEDARHEDESEASSEVAPPSHHGVGSPHHLRAKHDAGPELTGDEGAA